MGTVRVMDALMPFIVSAFGIILSIMLGMAVSKLGSIEQLSIRLSHHLENASIHEGGFARTDEQVKNLCAMVQKAHERLDKLAGTRG